MAIPDFQTIMLPILKLLADENEHSLSDIITHLETLFKLTEAEKEQRVPSGQQRIIYNRATWANTYLKTALLIETIKRGYYKITPLGLELLSKKPQSITKKFLYDEYPKNSALSAKKKDESTPTLLGGNSGEIINEQSPEEAIDAIYENIKAKLSSELLELILNNSPAFFEKLVVDLIVKMGYGGNRKEAGQAVGKTNDEGIDGVINEDRLGLDNIYIQAKRWNKDNTVGRTAIQGFVGALSGKQASKGIFITTSSFTKNAKEYVKTIREKVILIDGAELAEYMIEYNVGVTAYDTYTIKQVDSDYFAEV